MKRLFVALGVVVLLLSAAFLVFFTASKYRVKKQSYLQSLSDFVFMIGSYNAQFLGFEPPLLTESRYERVMGHARRTAHNEVRRRVVWSLKRWGEDVVPLLVREIELAPGVSRDDDGRPLSSRELFMAVNQRNDTTHQYETIQVRGVSPMASRVHSKIRIVRGRTFRRNAREVVLGAADARKRQLAPGQELRIGRSRWQVVGILEADGAVFESEVWCDLDQLAAEGMRFSDAHSSSGICSPSRFEH